MVTNFGSLTYPVFCKRWADHVAFLGRFSPGSILVCLDRRFFSSPEIEVAQVLFSIYEHYTFPPLDEFKPLATSIKYPSVVVFTLIVMVVFGLYNTIYFPRPLWHDD